jgi:two-component system, OmpR family, phosphate regulon sensor histidine kinase PhoR
MALIFGITVVPLGTLMWMGWRVLEQDRDLESHQPEERIVRAAGLLVESLQHALSSSEQRLAEGGTEWPEGAVAVTFRDGSVEVYPRDRIAYLPEVPRLPEAPAAVFAEAEEFEFRREDSASAIAILRELSKSPDLAIRAEAFFRLGNSLSSVGRIAEALTAYDEITAMDSVAIEGVPAGLISSWARCGLLEKSGRSAELRTEARRLAEGLNSGRWDLIHGVYWAYADDAARWSDTQPPSVRQPEVFAEAVEALFGRWRSLTGSNHDSLAIGEQNLTVLWQKSPVGVFRALIASPQFVEAQWLALADPIAKEHQVSFRLGDMVVEEGRLSTKRSASESRLPWNIVVTDSANIGQGSDFNSRRRWLVAGFILLASVVLLANYVIIRAINRELAVARLQSDFVAAVSHEFRTPLTSLRQFTDMLRGNEPDKDRRHLCYEAQSRATDRLTKLVESLLDFGRMEAGARRYNFEPRNCTELVGRVVEEFRAAAPASGYDVEFQGNGNALIEADGDALGRAVWNLLDNAVKYSPDHHTIVVQLHRNGGDVRIDVRDHGIGIPTGERPIIFVKFQRGEQARTRGIKGTGIGLTMVEEIVKAHHGRVEVQSEPGKGSTFTIVLPVKE